MSEKNNITLGLLLAFLAALLWSGNYVVARGMSGKITPVSLAFFRWLTATLVLLPLAIRKFRAEWGRLRPHWKYIVGTALTGVTFFNTFIYVAGKYTTAMNLAIIGTTAAPVFVLLIAHFILKERATLLQLLGTLLCIAGILLLICKGDLSQLAEFEFNRGDAWVLLAALFFAVYTVLVRRKPRELSALPFLFSLFLVGTLALFPAYLVDSALRPPLDWNTELLLVFLYLGVGASVGAFLSWNVSIHHIGPARTALFGNLIPVFSSIEAVLILDEKAGPVTWISLSVILAGLVLANYKQIRSSFG